MTTISTRKTPRAPAPRPVPTAELRALRAQLRAATALLDDPCHWCDPLEARGCAGCTRRAPDWRKGAAR